MSEDKKLISDLVSIVGKEYATDDIYDRYAYGTDPMPHDLDPEVIPRAVVRPKTSGSIRGIKVC